MKILETLRQNNQSVNLDALMKHIPYAKFIGIEIDMKGSELTTILPFKHELIGNPVLPAIHGGVLGAFLELTSTIQLLYNTDCQRMPKTVDISIDYLRSGRSVPTYGRAIVTKQGRRVANVRTEVWQEERAKPIALMHGHFLLKPN